MDCNDRPQNRKDLYNIACLITRKLRNTDISWWYTDIGIGLGFDNGNIEICLKTEFIRNNNMDEIYRYVSNEYNEKKRIVIEKETMIDDEVVIELLKEVTELHEVIPAVKYSHRLSQYYFEYMRIVGTNQVFLENMKICIEKDKAIRKFYEDNKSRFESFGVELHDNTSFCGYTVSKYSDEYINVIDVPSLERLLKALEFGKKNKLTVNFSRTIETLGCYCFNIDNKRICLSDIPKNDGNILDVLKCVDSVENY